MKVPNYYSLLKVPRNASITQIKTSYYRLAKQHHPDVSKDKDGTMFKKISEAYHILKNPELKERYDQDLQAQEQSEKTGFSSRESSKSTESGDDKADMYGNQYDYHNSKRKFYENPSMDFDYNHHHKYHDAYQQYFYQRNVYSDKRYHAKRNPDGTFRDERVHHQYDPNSNTHYYYHERKVYNDEEDFRRYQEEYRNFYTMSNTYDSYERSKNIPTVFGMRLEVFFAGLALLSVLYGLSQYYQTTKYKPYSNMYDREDDERL